MSTKSWGLIYCRCLLDALDALVPSLFPACCAIIQGTGEVGSMLMVTKYF